MIWKQISFRLSFSAMLIESRLHFNLVSLWLYIYNFCGRLHQMWWPTSGAIISGFWLHLTTAVEFFTWARKVKKCSPTGVNYVSSFQCIKNPFVLSHVSSEILSSTLSSIKISVHCLLWVESLPVGCFYFGLRSVHLLSFSRTIGQSKWATSVFVSSLPASIAFFQTEAL